MVVLAIDIGLRKCGYVACSVKKLDIGLISEGQIEPDPKDQLPKKLDFIHWRLQSEIKLHKPGAIVVEKLYSHHRHPVTLGVLAQVRGVVALLSYQEGIDFYEFSPTRARKSFLGKGRADSFQVKKMAENITGKKFRSEHTADAYSLVVAFSHKKKLENMMAMIDPKKTSYQIKKSNDLSNTRQTTKKRK